MEWASRFCVDASVVLAVDTGMDIAILKVIPHVEPEIGMTSGVVHLLKSKMAKGIVCKTKNIFMYSSMVWNYELLMSNQRMLMYLRLGIPARAHHKCGSSAGTCQKYLQVLYLWIQIRLFPWIMVETDIDFGFLQVPVYTCQFVIKPENLQKKRTKTGLIL